MTSSSHRLTVNSFNRLLKGLMSEIDGVLFMLGVRFKLEVDPFQGELHFIQTRSGFISILLLSLILFSIGNSTAGCVLSV